MTEALPSANVQIDRRRGRRSLGVTMAMVTVSVLAAMAFVMYQFLAHRELSHLVAAKVSAGEMLTTLFAQNVSAAVDFDDNSAVETQLRNLRVNSEVIFASVWSEGKASSPVAGVGDLTPGDDSRPVSEGTTLSSDKVVVVRPLLNPAGQRIGWVRMIFSLRPEKEAFEKARGLLIALTSLLALLAAVSLLTYMQRVVVGPVRALAAAAVKLQSGQMGARVYVPANNEIGDLGHTFNEMANALADREAKLTEVSGHLRDLFNHMKQAIVAFGRDGRIVGEGSQAASKMFERPELDGVHVEDLLYGKAPEYSVELRGFREWIELAFSSAPAGWAECYALAPREVLLENGGESTPVQLEFQPIIKSGRINQVMVLATDLSEKRKLETVVRLQEEQYETRVAAMRKMATGGVDVFLQFIELAQKRLDRARIILAENGSALPSPKIDEIFRMAHSIKAEARGFDLDDLEKNAHELEIMLQTLAANARGGGYAMSPEERSALEKELSKTSEELTRATDLFAATSPLGKAVFDQINVSRTALAALLEKAHNSGADVALAAARVAARPFGECALQVIDAAPEWALEEGKTVAVQLSGGDVRVAANVARILPGVLAHLVRNAIAHGVELPDVREAMGKPAHGTIRISAVAEVDGNEGDVFLVVEDDGGGLDEAQIRAKSTAAEDGLHEHTSALDELVFASGFSTRDAADMLAGHGMGLGAARADLASVGYKVVLRWKAGLYTRCEIRPATRFTNDSPNEGMNVHVS